MSVLVITGFGLLSRPYTDSNLMCEGTCIMTRRMCSGISPICGMCTGFGHQSLVEHWLLDLDFSESQTFEL